MIEQRHRQRAMILAGIAVVLGCASQPPEPSEDLMAPTEAQLKLRSFQTRTFEIDDRKRAMRGVIAVLQDLGFIIERANEPLGLVTAARFAEPDYYSVVGVTVTVRPHGEGRMMIRANAIFNNKPIDDPKVYQNFFGTLERSRVSHQEIETARRGRRIGGTHALPPDTALRRRPYIRPVRGPGVGALRC